MDTPHFYERDRLIVLLVGHAGELLKLSKRLSVHHLRPGADGRRIPRRPIRSAIGPQAVNTLEPPSSADHAEIS